MTTDVRGVCAGSPLGASTALSPPALFCRVLGPTEVEVNGVAVSLGGATSRRAMSALVADGGRPVADDRLIDLVWGQPAGDKINTLRVVIWRLRRALGSDAGNYLRRDGIGYALMVSFDLTDHGVFTAKVEQGLAELSAAEFSSAVRTFEAALSLWRGEPWYELGDTAHLAASRSRLAELREIAIEEMLAARVGCGDTAATVPALRAAVIEAPYRERRWELLAVALYRCGRQTHALAELRRVRELLLSEIGVEPGPALRSLEQRMLIHDPSLLAMHPDALRVS